jgi:hypothetical protein
MSVNLGILRFSTSPNKPTQLYFKSMEYVAHCCASVIICTVFNGFETTRKLVDVYIHEDEPENGDGQEDGLNSERRRTLICTHFEIAHVPELPVDLTRRTFVRLCVIYEPFSIG